MLSSLDEELETAQGNNEPEEQPSVAGSGTRMHLGDRSSAGATRYAAVQGAVSEDYPSLMPSLQINTDASYAATFESDREQAIDLFRTARKMHVLWIPKKMRIPALECQILHQVMRSRPTQMRNLVSGCLTS